MCGGSAAAICSYLVSICGIIWLWGSCMCGCGGCTPVLAQGHIFTAASATISVCFLYQYIPRESL